MFRVTPSLLQTIYVDESVKCDLPKTCFFNSGCHLNFFHCANDYVSMLRNINFMIINRFYIPVAPNSSLKKI